MPLLEVVDARVEEQSPCTDDNVRNCDHDFGDVVLGAGGRFTFRLINDAPIQATIDDIVIDGDAAFSLTGIDGFPLAVQPRADELEPVEITVRFAPTAQGSHEATVTVFSDAVNVEEGEGIAIRLTGNGVAPVSSAAATPSACEFGSVLPGTVAYCDVTVTNHGQLDLVLGGLAFSDDTPLALTDDDVFDPALDGFGLATPVFLPLFVAPGTATTFRLFAHPPTANEMTGSWQIETNVPSSPVIEVPLKVTGAATPTAVAEVFSVDGVETDDPSPQIQPRDDVVLTCEDSVPSTPEGEIVSCAWEIAQKPHESSVTLTNPVGTTTGFQFDSAAGTSAGLDVAGTYEVRLTVTDDLGLVSTNDATVVLNSIPQDALHVQLTWDTPDVDLDLHMVKDGDNWCSTGSCYYGNCLATSAYRPEWDGVTGVSDGDPSLDINDVSGFGPESITLRAPVGGDYRVGVHAFSSSIDGELNATLKVFVGGALAYEDTRLVAAGRDFWEVAEVAWEGGGGVTFPIGDYESSWTCP